MTSAFSPLLASGIMSVVLAVYARRAEQRRLRRRKLDAVGIVPWETVFVLSLIGAFVLLSFAFKAWVAS